MKFTTLLKNSIGTAVLAGALFMAPAAAHARVFVSVAIAPPAIPVYTQPIAPGDGYIWTPGYWAWNGDGYEWVDGAWVVAPYVGALWTPGYWGYGDGGYFWNAGYWGPSVGYYGGINYGFGYFGTGFYGGYWGGNRFFYNRAYCNLGYGRGFRNIYDRPYGHFDGRPGGNSWAHGYNDGNRGSYAAGNRFDGNRGGNLAGNRYGNRGENFSNGQRGNENLAVSRPVYGGFGNNNAGRQPYNGGNGYRNSPEQVRQNLGTQAHSFAMPSESRQAYAGKGGNFHANNNMNAAAPRGDMGGGFHGNMGGGGYHGGDNMGGGGGGFHGGGNMGGGGGGFHGGGNMGGGGGGFHGGGGGHR